jgi:N-acetylglucosaminyl-diphospho-decaprenol L-rhamnosyltransferase
MAVVDVVIVSYNSRDRLRACVERLCRNPDVHVIVVDNDSADGSLEVIADLPVDAVAQSTNLGFAHGVNVGWRRGRSPYVLLLNPDARIGGPAVAELVSVLESDRDAAIAAPRILHEDGTLDHSQRRFPRLRSTYAQAFFVHRLFPVATWTDEVVRDRRAYMRRTRPEWASGACLLVRRSTIEALQGLDERFFLYCEDKDLARRAQTLGQHVVYEPAAFAVHTGGASTPGGGLQPVLAASRIAYARKHRGTVAALLEQLGVGLGALSHLAVPFSGRARRRGYAAALGVALGHTPGSTPLSVGGPPAHSR